MDEKTMPETIRKPDIRTLAEIKWLSDEKLLRDEGAYYGLSGANSSEKVEAIKKSFSELMAQFQSFADHLLHTIAQLQTESKTTELQLEQKYKELEELVVLNETTHKLFRQLTGLLIYCFGIGFTFWLIYDRLEGVIVYPILVSLGCYLLGAFSLFHERSILFHRNKSILDEQELRESWKIYLEEFGIPFVVTLFVITISFDVDRWPVEITVGLLMYILLLFSGKGMLSYIQKVNAEFRFFIFSWKKKRNNRMVVRKCKKEIKEMEQSIKKNKVRINFQYNELKDAQAQVDYLSAQCDAKVALFLAEYEFAREFRHQHPRDEVEAILQKVR